MSRNLLPRFRTKPNPVSIPLAKTAEWTPMQQPQHLAQLEYGGDDDKNARTQVQSIPSPWARMLLFRHALEDELHPARALVTTELLDALELVWSLDSLGAAVTTHPIDLAALGAAARGTGSRRVAEFADATHQLAPDDLNEITVVMLGTRPLFATSPYTLLFTAEDAGEDAPGEFFKFAKTAQRRPLAERPSQFQQYVAEVLYPQINQVQVSPTMRGLLNNWLIAELAAPPFAGAPANADWQTNAARMELRPLSGRPLGGIILYKGDPRARIRSQSRWVLRASGQRPEAPRPLVISPTHFDGVYFQGVAPVRLPSPLPDDRERLPVAGVQYPWVHPETDWLSSEILLLNEPIRPSAVYGLAAGAAGNYQWHGPKEDQRFGTLRMLLPLRSEFFKYFTPADVERMLTIEVLPNQAIVATLRVPVGAAGDTIAIQRQYQPTDIRRETGPGIAVWPSFVWDNGKTGAEANAWSQYLVFRKDNNDLVAKSFTLRAFRDGVQLTDAGAERADVARVLAFDKPPEVLEVVNTLAPDQRGASLGVLLPRLERRETATQSRWRVGVDFGTSNTVVSLRVSGQQQSTLFGYEHLTLFLTEPAGSMRDFIQAYFFPEGLERKPFGTAVVHLTHLKHLSVRDDKLGVSVNIPFTGHVKTGDRNRVAGDLKWSTEDFTRFLSMAFMRHLLSTVAAQAIHEGVDPTNLTFAWSHPRAFSGSDRDNLADIWMKALDALPVKVAPVSVKTVLDESQAVLRYFFRTHVGRAGRTNVIMDVGGGTTDIAAYGGGRTILLDSVLFGGRELTGVKLHGNGAGGAASNPFVEEFIEWASTHGLPDSDRSAVKAYMEAGQIHLAFGYVVSTEWFRSGQATGFRGQPAFQNFQALVLYFFGALSYYLGLSLRVSDAKQERQEGQEQQEGREQREQQERQEQQKKLLDQLPVMVVLAGNGSRYADWLTGMVRMAGPNDVFLATFRRLLAAGIGIEDVSQVRLPEVVLSDAPKEEVARGLVEEVGHDNPDEGTAATTSVVGESIELASGREGTKLKLEAHARFGAEGYIARERVHEVKWLAEKPEIERFHAALIRECPTLAAYSDHFRHLAERYDSLFRSLDRDKLRNDTLRRMEYHAQAHKEFHGSIFMLEASVVLEHMMATFFRPTGVGGLPPKSEGIAVR